jgi:hypothetical protein
MPPALVLGALLLAGLVGPAAASADTGATLYVDQHNANCSNTGVGTAAQPFCAIGAAATKTAPGTTVLISSGTYAEAVKPPVSGTPGSPVTYAAAPGANVVVTGSGTLFDVHGQSWISIKGLTISGTGCCTAVNVTNTSASVASNVQIVGDQVIGGVSAGGSQVTVIGNRVDGIHLTGTGYDVEDNTVVGIALSGAAHSRVAGNSVGAGGIYLYGAGDATLVDNAIQAGPVTRAVTTTSPAGGRGVEDEYSNNVVMTDNTIVVSPSNANYAINVLGGSGTQILANSIAQFAPSDAVEVQGPATLANNVIAAFHSAAGAAIHVDSGAVSGTYMDYDLVNAADGKPISWSGSSYSSLAKFTPATGQEPHGIQGPPGFADPAGGNLSLVPGSPAIDSGFAGSLGTPAGLVPMPTTDAWGGARVDDAATPNTGAGTISYADRGAYEMRNPSFEANAAGWNTSGSSAGVTLTQVAGGHTGAGAALLTNTGTTPATCDLNDSPNIVRTTTAGTYTATLWVRADNPGAMLTLRLREWGGSVAIGQAKATVALTSEWRPVTVQYTVGDPGGSTLDFNAYVMNAAPGTCFYADDASIATGVTVPAAGAAANRLTASDGAADDGLGSSVAVSGNAMVVGAPYATVGGHAGQGAVYVYTNSGGSWTQAAKLTAADGAAYNNFGYSVGISGGTVVVGAPSASVNGQAKEGAAYVFSGSGSAWTQQAKLMASDGGAGYQIGYAVAVSGTTVVAGAVGCPATVGRAYVFTPSGGAWTQHAELIAPNGCGHSLAASDGTVVLGALGWGAYVFTESSGVWSLQATLKPSGLTGYYPVGSSVAVSGSTVVLGVPAAGITGAAYVFTSSGGVWSQQAKLTAPEGATSDMFGASLAISGGTVVVGGPDAIVNGRANQGETYAFTNAGGAWAQQAELSASDGATGDQLGTSVAVSGTTVVAGAPYANSLLGAAYVFGGS